MKVNNLNNIRILKIFKIEIVVAYISIILPIFVLFILRDIIEKLNCLKFSVIVLFFSIPVCVGLYTLSKEKRFFLISTFLKEESKIRKFFTGNKFRIVIAIILSIIFTFLFLMHLYQPVNINVVLFIFSPIFFLFFYKNSYKFFEENFRDEFFKFFKKLVIIFLFVSTLSTLSIVIDGTYSYLNPSKYEPFSPKIVKNSKKEIKSNCRLVRVVSRNIYFLNNSFNSFGYELNKSTYDKFLGFILFLLIKTITNSATFYTALAFYLLGTMIIYENTKNIYRKYVFLKRKGLDTFEIILKFSLKIFVKKLKSFRL
jgi:hypothetical protein